MLKIFVSMNNAERTYLQGKIHVKALESASCEVVSGSRIALVGPSGSGKSTLLHLMGGLDSPTSGSITWPELGPKKNLRPKKIGFIFQVQSLLAPLTVIENVELPLLLDGIPQSQAQAAAMAAIQQIELESIANKLPEELSGGQAQRVAVARALSMQPKLILADEPTGQLDHPTAKRLFDVLLAALKKSDTALIVATHDKTIAQQLQTVWHMSHGNLKVEK